MGYLPEAVTNYLGRMGWSMPNGEEKFSLDTMQSAFDIQRVSLGGPIFDVEKLNWLNGLWIREELDDAQLAQRLHHWLLNEENLLKVIPHVKPRMEILSDFIPAAGFLASGMLPISEANFSELKLPVEDQKKLLQFVLWRLEASRTWERDALFTELKSLADALDIKMKDFLAPVFVAISGSTSSFSVMDAMVLLGSDLSRARVRFAIDTLGGAGKKVLKRYEKEYAVL